MGYLASASEVVGAVVVVVVVAVAGMAILGDRPVYDSTRPAESNAAEKSYERRSSLLLFCMLAVLILCACAAGWIGEQFGVTR